MFYIVQVYMNIFRRGQNEALRPITLILNCHKKKSKAHGQLRGT